MVRRRRCLRANRNRGSALAPLPCHTVGRVFQRTGFLVGSNASQVRTSTRVALVDDDRLDDNRRNLPVSQPPASQNSQRHTPTIAVYRVAIPGRDTGRPTLLPLRFPQHATPRDSALRVEKTLRSPIADVKVLISCFGAPTPLCPPHPPTISRTATPSEPTLGLTPVLRAINMDVQVFLLANPVSGTLL